MMKKARKADPEYKTSEKYAQWIKGISNAGYHYSGSAECFIEMSDAFATAKIEMIEMENHK